ncbi:testis anion transporter 1 [Tachyglossus aculeatus]|uniref:testis anion transporter 1 n=1 Tax=Tachyglossus aculeatus TaxID=9261 RepID=UPI0018F71671|nr:testis anion transporter 1 [Tachyglossus aculeatus]
MSFGSRNRARKYIYNVRRDVYNEENFQREHKRRPSSVNVDIHITTVRHRVQCRCSWRKFRRIVLMLFPFLKWVCVYRLRDWLLGDVLAGLNVGLIQIPQGLAIALLTRLLIPPLNIFYSTFCCSMLYIIFGTSHHVSVGSFFLVSALMAPVLQGITFNSGNLLVGNFAKGNFSDPEFMKNYNQALSMMATLTFLTGVIQLLLGFFCLGFITKYLSETVMNAYLAATALHMMVSQLCYIFGFVIHFHTGPLAFFYNILDYCLGLPKANSTSILLFLICLVTLRVNKCIKISFKGYPIEFPMEFILIVGFTVIASQIHLSAETSKTIIEMIPNSFLNPAVPDMTLLRGVIVNAFSLATVSYFLLIFVGRRFAYLHNYTINCNQELIAIGLCNVLSAFFRSFVFTCAIARTVIQEKSGGRQQFAALIGAVLMLLLVLKLDYLFYELPNAVLAGIILSNVLPFLGTILDLPCLWKQDVYDFMIWIMTFIAVICLGLDIGLAVAMVFTFFIISVRSHRTKILILGQIPDTNIYRSFTDYREVVHIPGLKIFQCCSSISFVNIGNFKRILLREVDLKALPLDEEEMRDLFYETESNSNSSRDFKCGCNCEEPEPPPRISFTERLKNRSQTDSSSSINLVHCSRYEGGTPSWPRSESHMPCPGNLAFPRPSRAQAPQKEEVERIWIPSSQPALTSEEAPSDNQVFDSQDSKCVSKGTQEHFSEDSYMPNIHTIILDFSMVHFVDLQASKTLRQICNAFHNIDVLVLIAGCHPSVVRAFERNDFFDSGISKAQLFLSLHDAVLFAVARRYSKISEVGLEESSEILQNTYPEEEQSEHLKLDLDSSLERVQKEPISSFLEFKEEPELELDLELEPKLPPPSPQPQTPARPEERRLYSRAEVCSSVMDPSRALWERNWNQMKKS